MSLYGVTVHARLFVKLSFLKAVKTKTLSSKIRNRSDVFVERENLKEIRRVVFPTNLDIYNERKLSLGVMYLGKNEYTIQNELLLLLN